MTSAIITFHLSSFSSHKFAFQANQQRLISSSSSSSSSSSKSGGKIVRASSSVATTSINEDSTSTSKHLLPRPSQASYQSSNLPFWKRSSIGLVAGKDGSSSSSMGRRRGIAYMASIPFVLAVGACVDVSGVHAQGVGSTAYSTIQEGIRKVLSKGKSAGVLRLVFHDAGTFDMTDNSGGMNGSIVYELDRPENVGLKKSLKILEKVKSEINEAEPVSWADMIAVAGAEAVLACGGPAIHVKLGRVDSMVPDPDGKLPEETLDASGLKQCFLRKGFS